MGSTAVLGCLASMVAAGRSLCALPDSILQTASRLLGVAEDCPLPSQDCAFVVDIEDNLWSGDAFGPGPMSMQGRSPAQNDMPQGTLPMPERDTQSGKRQTSRPETDTTPSIHQRPAPVITTFSKSDSSPRRNEAARPLPAPCPRTRSGSSTLTRGEPHGS